MAEIERHHATCALASSVPSPPADESRVCVCVYVCKHIPDKPYHSPRYAARFVGYGSCFLTQTITRQWAPLAQTRRTRPAHQRLQSGPDVNGGRHEARKWREDCVRHSRPSARVAGILETRRCLRCKRAGGLIRLQFIIPRYGNDNDGGDGDCDDRRCRMPACRVAELIKLRANARSSREARL